MKKIVLLVSVLASISTGMAQSLDKMQWFNEPESWEIKDNVLTMDVTPKSDFWRISHYGFTVDDGPVLYTTRGGEFEAHHTSDWSVIRLEKPVPFVWIKAVRRLDAVEIFYSFDDKEYTMMRTCWMQDNTPMMVGMMAASPDGNGFQAKFEHFQIKHLPDQRRLEWLKHHQ